MPEINNFTLLCYKADAELYGWTLSVKGLEAYALQRERGLRYLWAKRKAS